MNSDRQSKLDREQQLTDLIGQFLSAAEDSPSPSETGRIQQNLIDAHPDFADDLRNFFDMHDRLQNVAATGSQAEHFPTTTLFKQSRDDFAQTTDPAGKCFGDYEIIKLIARGGMGVVYKARQISLNRTVALKMIQAGELAGEQEVKRFQAEAEAAAKLEHPCIVPIFEVGVIDDTRYFSMAFVEGPSLADKIAEGPIAPYEAAELTMKIAEAVDYAHQRGIIHRDLKPGNVLLTTKPQSTHPDSTDSRSSGVSLEKSFYSPSQYLPKLTDFGLAKHIGDNSELTEAGQILGTPSYMSPEQAAGRHETIDERSDIYSIGAILYAALTGHAPHHKESKLETILHVINEDPRHVRDHDRRIPKPLAIIAHKCLEKKPGDRYQSASELADDLKRCLNREPIVAKPASVLSQIWRWSRQRPALAVTVASLLVFYLCYLSSAYLIWPEAEPTYSTATITLLVFIWLGVAAIFQTLIIKLPNWKEGLTYVWASLDVVMFTAILATARGVESPALVVYPLLVAGTGLRYRIGLVWMVSAVCLAGYWWLLLASSNWLEPGSNIARSAPIYFSLCLIIIALIMHLVL